MPRPKRTRGLATRRAANQGGESSAPTATQPPAGNTALPSSSSTDIYDLSDREKEKTHARKAGISAEVDNSVLQNARSRPGVGVNTRRTKALETSMGSRDESTTRRGDLTSTTNTLNASDDVESPPEIGRRSHASLRGRPTDVSGLDLDDDVFGDLDDSLVSRDDSHSVPHSTDTSSLTVGAFRKRPRKSSIASRDDAPIRPSSRGQNTSGISSTFSFGHFKRRPRAPSILGSRKGRSHSRQPHASGDETDTEREFTRTINPTPMRYASRQPSAAPSSVGSRQASTTRRTRKRKSLEDHGSAHKRAALDDSEDDIHDSIELDDSPAASPRGRSPVRLPSPARLATPDPNDPDLAPPMSSGSSDAGDAIWPPLESLAHRTYRTRRAASRAQKTPELGDSGSDISSPPSLTHSPNLRPAVRAKKNVQPPKAKVTTADLASLLPRRRHKQTASNPFDIPSSDADDGSTLGNEDDELSYTNTRATRSKRSSRPADATSSGTKGKHVAGTGKVTRRTYGSRSSDKENQAEEEAAEDTAEAEDGNEELPVAETSQMMLARLGEELKNAAKKFKEVDKWELEFEEDNEPSSPVGAR